MNWRSCTLLGRTAFSLGLLLLVSQGLWLGLAAFYFIKPIKKIYLRNIAVTVELAHAQVTHGVAEVDWGANADFRIIRDSQARPPLKTYDSDALLNELVDHLGQRYGSTVVLLKERDNSALWIRFPVRGEYYWAVIPKGAPPIPFFMLASVGVAIAVALLGAYAIIYSLTKQLRGLTVAVQAFGRGELAIPIEEKGPLEILNLSKGFNQMAVDLRKLDEDRRIMLAGISHDLKTPLTRLRIAVELAESQTDQELSAGMVHDIEEMDSILKQFLDYARDGTEEQPVVCDLNVIAGEVCERYRAAGHAIELKLGEMPAFPLRKLAIYRAITNIVDNAVRYGRDGVRIETQAEGNSVRILVTDRGPGIKSGNPADYVKAFARENVSRTEPGAGLGLAIVDRVVRTHGGQLHLENRTAGGLLVRIDLPAGVAGKGSV